MGLFATLRINCIANANATPVIASEKVSFCGNFLALPVMRGTSFPLLVYFVFCVSLSAYLTTVLWSSMSESGSVGAFRFRLVSVAADFFSQ